MYIYFCKQTRYNMPLVSPLSAEQKKKKKKEPEEPEEPDAGDDH